MTMMFSPSQPSSRIPGAAAHGCTGLWKPARAPTPSPQPPGRGSSARPPASRRGRPGPSPPMAGAPRRLSAPGGRERKRLPPAPPAPLPATRRGRPQAACQPAAAPPQTSPRAAPSWPRPVSAGPGSAGRGKWMRSGGQGGGWGESRGEPWWGRGRNMAPPAAAAPALPSGRLARRPPLPPPGHSPSAGCWKLT